MPAELGKNRVDTRSREGASTAAAKPPAAASPSPWPRFEAFERLVGTELGPLREGADPLLAKARSIFATLSPPADADPPSPEAQAKGRSELVKVLDQLEDLLDALQLAAHGGNRPRKRG